MSDVIAHLAVHRELPRAKDWVLLFRIAAGGLSTLITPAIVLLLGIFDVIEWLAVRRAHLAWCKQLIVLGALVVLGLLVIWVQSLAHGLGGEHCRRAARGARRKVANRQHARMLTRRHP